MCQGTPLIRRVIRWLGLGTLVLAALPTHAETPFSHAAVATVQPARPRVVIAQNEQATEAFRPRPDVVRRMMREGLQEWTRKSSSAAAWLALVSTQDVVGLKVYATPGAQVGTRPATVAAAIEGLIEAGLPRHHIVIWDRRLSDLRRAGFLELAQSYGVRAAGSLESGWDESVSYDSALIGQLVFGDLEFQKKADGIGRKSFVSKLITRDLTKIINISPLLNHNSVGVCGNLYSLAMGSVDNSIRFEGEAGKLAQAVPEIYALPQLGDRVVLSIVDALICQYEGETIGRLHNSVELNQLRFSTDPVILDVLSVAEINEQRRHSASLTAARTNRIELLQNASLLELGLTDTNKVEIQFLPLHP